MTGKKIPDNILVNRSIGDFFSNSLSLLLLFSSTISCPKSFWTSSYIFETFGPITTWYCPPCCKTDMTSSSFSISDVFAIVSSFNTKRRRVTQCVSNLTFFAPPTFSTISFAVFSMMIPPFMLPIKNSLDSISMN